jgi:hypothetical protein
MFGIGIPGSPGSPGIVVLGARGLDVIGGPGWVVIATEPSVVR